MDGVCEETEVSVDDDEIICDLAKKYYKKMNGQTPPIASIDILCVPPVFFHNACLMTLHD